MVGTHLPLKGPRCICHHGTAPWHPHLQVQVVGTASEVVGITLETKPRRKNKRNILFDMTPSYKDGLVSTS